MAFVLFVPDRGCSSMYDFTKVAIRLSAPTPATVNATPALRLAPTPNAPAPKPAWILPSAMEVNIRSPPAWMLEFWE